MMEEALNLYLDEPAVSDITDPIPDRNIKGKNIVEVPVDPQIAFALKIRHLRIKNILTQKQVLEMLGMKNIFSYQRLEKNSNPRLTILAKIKKVFPEFSVDDILNT